MTTGTTQAQYLGHSLALIGQTMLNRERQQKYRLRSCMDKLDPSCIFLTAFSLYTEDSPALIPALVREGVGCELSTCLQIEAIIHDTDFPVDPFGSQTGLPVIVGGGGVSSGTGGSTYTAPPDDLWLVVGTSTGAPDTDTSSFNVPNSLGWNIRLELNKVPVAPLNWDGAWYSKQRNSTLLELHNMTWQTGDLIHISYYGS